MTRNKYSTTDVWPPDHFNPILIEMGRLIPLELARAHAGSSFKHTHRHIS
jgi:hypothetical protein